MDQKRSPLSLTLFARRASKCVSHLATTRLPTSTMTTARPRKRLGVIVRAGAAEGWCRDPCGCPGEEWGRSPSYYNRCRGESSRSQELIVRTAPKQIKTAKGTRPWPRRLADFAHLLHNPYLAIASLLTLLEVAGQNERWYWMLGLALTNLLVVRLVVWLTTTAVLYSLVLLHEAWKRSTSGQTHTKPWR